MTRFKVTRRDVICVALLTVVIEAFTCVMRFGLGLEAAAATGWFARYSFGLRIHHAYVGVALVVACGLLLKPSFWRTWGLYVGMAMILSDLVHHLLVLWPIVGSPELNLTY